MQLKRHNEIIEFSIQRASSWHPPPQLSQGQRPFGKQDKKSLEYLNLILK